MTGPGLPLQPSAPAGPPQPVTGAWREGDLPGNRQFHLIKDGRPFALEGGGWLPEATVAFETWGTLDADAGNAVLLCHALTGDSHAAGPSGPAHKTAGWWDELIGPGRPLDTDRYFVVCANVLGGCQGSTGPASPHPDDGRPWGPRFPVISIRDIVRSQACLADALGIGEWLCVIGGSMGGMQALEWTVMFPDRVKSSINIASAAAASPFQIGWSRMGRRAIINDPGWQGGWYYDAEPGEGPHNGLELARAIAHIHYRSDESFDQRFGRETVDKLDRFNMWDRFQVEGYLDYQGAKLVRRFDANSYLVLNKAMDLHDIGRDRGGVDAALSRVSCPMLVASVSSDILYTPRQQQALVAGLERVGASVSYEVVESIHGHDGFLMEFGKLAPTLERFVADQAKS